MIEKIFFSFLFGIVLCVEFGLVAYLVGSILSKVIDEKYHLDTYDRIGFGIIGILAIVTLTALGYAILYGI